MVGQLRRWRAARRPTTDAGADPVERLGVGQQVGRPPLAPAHVVEEGVGGDPAQPALEGAGLIGDEAPLHSHQHLLDQVLRVVVVAAEPVRHRVEEPPVGAGDLLPGGNALRRTFGGRRTRHDNDREAGVVPGRGRPETSVRRRGPSVPRPSSSVRLPSATPSLNSFWAWPSERASFGSLAPPNSSRTTSRMMSSSGAPRFTWPRGVPRHPWRANLGPCWSASSTSPRAATAPCSTPSPTAAGADLLDLHADPDHHRARAHPRRRASAPAGGRRVAVDRIDLRRPRRRAPAHRRRRRRAVRAARRTRRWPTPSRARDDFGAWAGERRWRCRASRYGPERTLPDVRRRAFADLGARLRADASRTRPPARARSAPGRSLVAYNLWLADAGRRPRPPGRRRRPGRRRSAPSGSPSATACRCR